MLRLVLKQFNCGICAQPKPEVLSMNRSNLYSNSSDGPSQDGVGSNRANGTFYLFARKCSCFLTIMRKVSFTFTAQITVKRKLTEPNNGVN